MTEVAEKRKTLPTVELKRFVPEFNYRNTLELQNLFDSIPIKEVREAVLSQLRNPAHEETMDWHEERISDFMERKGAVLGDFRTVLMLLRNISYVSESFRPRAFACILDVFEWMFRDCPEVDEYMKEIIVIFCGHIKRNPESYGGGRASEAVKKILSFSGYGMSSQTQMRNIGRLIQIVSMVRDVELLSEVERYVMPLMRSDRSTVGLDHKFKYLSISEEDIEVDASARQCVALLEGLCR